MPQTMQTSTCVRCARKIVYMPVGLLLQWVTDVNDRRTWECGDESRLHRPVERLDAQEYSDLRELVWECIEAIGRGDACPACLAEWKPDPTGMVHRTMTHTDTCRYVRDSIVHDAYVEAQEKPW